jgi:uncharacterized protein involved in outer membrane biogenesis
VGKSDDGRSKIRILRWLGIATVALLGVPIAATAVVMVLGVTFSLEAFRADIEAAATGALGRTVAIAGPITLLAGLRPTIAIQGLRIANPPGWETADFLRLDRARATVNLLPLLSREISIDEIVIEGVDVRLEAKANGESNWEFEPETSEAAVAATDGETFEFVRLGELAMRSLAIKYRDEDSSETFEIEFEIEALDASAGRDDLTVLSARGLAQQQSFKVSATGGSLAALSDPIQPWSLNVTSEIAGTVVSLSGSIAEPLYARGIDLNIAITGEKLEALEPLTKSPLPPVGPYAVTGRLAQSETGYHLSRLEGSMGNTTFSGDFDLDRSASRPRLSGNLDVVILDLEPFLTDEPGRSGELPGNADKALEGKEQARSMDFSFDEGALSLDALRHVDADVVLSVDRVMGVPTDIRGVSLIATVGDGQLTAPITVTVSDVPIEGQLAIRSADDALGFSLSLSSGGSDISNLPEAIKRTETIKGSFERFTLQASGRGRDVRTALESLDVLMTIGRADIAYGREGGEEPVPLTLESFELALPKGQALRLGVRGSLLDEAFSVDVTSATVAEMLSNTPWPIAISATGAGARFSLKGTVPELTDMNGTSLNMNFGGERIGDLAAWLGVTPDAQAGYEVSGRLSLRDDKAYFESARANLGQTALTGKLSASWRDQDLLLNAKVLFTQIEVEELAALFADQEKPNGEDERPGLDLYMPILPYGVKIADADLDVAVERVRLQPVDVTNVTFRGRFREGRLKKSPFTATLGEVPFEGQLSLDLRGQVPAATFDIKSENVDVGSLLRDFQIVESSETKARRVEVAVILRGGKLKTIIEKSEISILIEGGVTIIRDPNTQAPLEIGIVKSTLSSMPGRPIIYDVDGRIEATPVRFRIETNPLASFLESNGPVPLRLIADTAGMHVEMNASVAPPFTLRNLRFDLSVAGGKLDGLDELLQVSVPPWGPYALNGEFQLDRDGYRARKLDVRVGNSRLIGDVSLDTTGTRPRLDVNLEAKTLQLNDFLAGDWSAFEYDASNERSDDGDNRSQSLQTGKAKVEALFTSESMRALDARLSLAANEILSGEDHLGRGRLVATLEDGRLSLDPVRVEIPEGSADAQFSFEMSESDVTTRTKVNIEHLDYGVLARRIDPAADPTGWLSLDVDLQSRSESLNDMMKGARGRFDFAVWPKNMQADVFDLWAANLILAILPRIDSGSGSKVNCVVGVFDAADGIMKPKTFLVDTTNVQVSGDGDVNFKNRQIDLVLTPNAKRPTMFTLATPIRVSGSYSDLQTSTSPDEWAITVGRFVTSIFAPIKRIFTTPIPTDGEAACLAAMERTAR